MLGLEVIRHNFRRFPLIELELKTGSRMQVETTRKGLQVGQLTPNDSPGRRDQACGSLCAAYSSSKRFCVISALFALIEQQTPQFRNHQRNKPIPIRPGPSRRPVGRDSHRRLDSRNGPSFATDARLIFHADAV